MDTEGAERARLAAVDSYRLIDAPRPAVLDELTHLAATIFGTPMSSVTLVDGERQWFAGNHGMPGPDGSREHSFCAQMITSPRPLIVRDARRHPVFRHWSNVLGAPYIRFYAGVPLVDEDGQVLGGVCVIDNRPRNIAPERVEILRVLAGQAAGQLRAIRGARRMQELTEELSHTLSREEDLVAAVSHELRTPVTTMQGYLELLGDEPDLAPYKGMLEPIQRNGQRLIRMVDHLLAGTRAPETAMTLRREAVDLREVAERGIAACQPLAAQRRCSISLTIEARGGAAVVDADTIKLADAVEQLVRNAVWFSHQGGRVEVVVGCGESPYISIRDSGVGIPADELPYVLGRFYRGRHAREQAVPGVGLGLSIARRVAIAHGGDLLVTSGGQDEGTTALLTIPPAQPRPMAAERDKGLMVTEPKGVGGLDAAVRGR